MLDVMEGEPQIQGLTQLLVCSVFSHLVHGSSFCCSFHRSILKPSTFSTYYVQSSTGLLSFGCMAHQKVAAKILFLCTRPTPGALQALLNNLFWLFIFLFLSTVPKIHLSARTVMDSLMPFSMRRTKGQGRIYIPDHASLELLLPILKKAGSELMCCVS